ncbi:MAG: ABC transporter permease, partial [Thermodesulfobacteriota bacterium]|nr:ABC transporter permease [Thermodesulfobacteriota bacterium]
GLVDLLIKAALVCGLMLWYGIIPDPIGVFLAILAIIPLYLLTLGMGFVFSLAAGVLRDIPNIINVLLMIFMLFTPVLYVSPEGTLLYRMNIYNPLNYLVNGPRELLLSGELICFGGFMSFAVIAVLVFFIGRRLFYVAQTKVAERL